jgi:hypothetical protein
LKLDSPQSDSDRGEFVLQFGGGPAGHPLYQKRGKLEAELVGHGKGVVGSRADARQIAHRSVWRGLLWRERSRRPRARVEGARCDQLALPRPQEPAQSPLDRPWGRLLCTEHGTHHAEVRAGAPRARLQRHRCFRCERAACEVAGADAARDCRRLDARAIGPFRATEGMEGLRRPVEALLRGHQPPLERGKPPPGFASEGC